MGFGMKKSINCARQVKGAREVKRYVRRDMVDSVFLAKNADEGLKAQIILLCQTKNIPVKLCSSKEAMGQAFKIDVPCAVVGMLKEENHS